MAEAIGTGIIIGGGCGCVCANRYANYPLGLLGVPVVFGASVAIAVYATRDVSGAHLNPAMTAAFALHRPNDAPPKIWAPYIASQMFGATAAAAINYGIYQRGIKAHEVAEKITRGAKGSYTSAAGAFGMTHTASLLKVRGAFFLEIGATAALAFTIFALTDSDKSVPPDAAPALIGLTVVGLATQFAPVTGCGMNPARDLGPRLVTYAMGWGSAALHPGWWIYTMGPMFGALFGSTLYQLTLAKRKK